MRARTPHFLCYFLLDVGAMSGESTETQLARVDEQLKSLLASMGKLEGVVLTVHDLAAKVESLDNRLTQQAPTIDEFITIKHKVVGAGILGRWLWVAGAFILGTVASGRMKILSHLTGVQ